MKKNLLLLAVLFSISASYAQLSGTYTIYGVMPNYATIQAACSDLQTQGQSGPVIFNIRDGNHIEEVTLNTVSGNSATNTITFQSASSDSSLVSVSSTTGNTFTFSNVNYVHFKYMGIKYSGASGMAVNFINGGNSSSFDNTAIFYNPSTGTYAIYADRALGVNNFSITNSSITSQFGGVQLNSNAADVNNFTMNNSIITSVHSSVYIDAEKFANNATISNCDISSNISYGVRIHSNYGSVDNLSITNSTLSSVNSNALNGYSEFTMNNGTINNSSFNSENGTALSIEGYSGSVSNWMVTNSRFTGQNDAFYASSDQNITNMTFVNDSMIVNPLGICCSYGDALSIDGNSLVENIDIHDNYFYTDSADYGGRAVRIEANDGLLIDVMCYNNEVKSKYGFYFYAEAVGENWWIDNNVISTRYNGIELEPYYGSGSNIVVTNNNIEVGSSDGIYIYSDAILQDCRVDSNIVVSYSESITIEGYDGGCFDIQVIDNQLTSTSNDGIYLYSDAVMQGIEIAGNVINSDDYGIYMESYDGGMSDVNIEDNNLITNDYGIYLETDGVLQTTSITNNTIDSYDEGIYLEGYYGGIKNVIVDNNNVYSESDDGIYLYTNATLSNTDVTNNLVYGDTVNCCDAAIYLESDDANMNNVNVSNNQAYAYYYGIYLEADYGNGTNCKVSNNDVWAGDYGIYFDGAGSGSEISFNNINPIPTYGTQLNSGIYTYGSGGPNTGLNISNNVISDVDGYGIEAYYYNDLIIENNEISSTESDSNQYGLYLEYIGGSGSKVNANKLLTSAESRGIYLGYSAFTASNPLVISNNFISGYEYGFDIQDVSFVDLIHNSVASSTMLHAVSFNDVTNMHIWNNIFKNSNTSGEMYYANGGISNIVMDYNAYHYDTLNSFMSNDIYFGTNSSLHDFQTNYGMSANSFYADPMFINDTLDLHISCGNSALTAGAITSIFVDVDGIARNATTPTIGAHEIAPGDTDFLPDSAYLCLVTTLMSSATGSYLWSTGETTRMITVSNIGTYYCTITDGCGFTSNDTVVVWTETPTANFAWGLNNTQGIFSNTSIGGSSYFWDFGDGNTSTSENPMHTYTWGYGTYTVLLTVTNDCGGVDTISQVLTILSLEVEEESLESRGIVVYPNPTKDDVTVDFTLLLNENIAISVVDMNGRVVYSDNISNEVGKYKKQLNIAELENGMYLLKIKTETETITKRIIKQ